jgi:hypothetical protein
MSETTARPRKARRAASEPPELTREEIAARAYEIAHGEQAGTDEENWLRAERELRSRPT